MNKNLFLLSLLFLFPSLILWSQHQDNVNIVTINTDSCAIWKLPDLNLSLYFPKGYKIAFNSSGGFYLQAHKYNDNKKMLAEISIGRIEGDFNQDSSIDWLRVADKEIRKQLEELNQKYDTRFIGNDTIFGEISLPQLRNYIRFERLNLALDGAYYGFSAPIFIDQKNRFMISAMFETSEKFSDKRMIGEDLIEVLKSITPKINN